MRIVIGIIFVTALVVLAVMTHGMYMWEKGYDEGFKQCEKYIDHKRQEEKDD